MGEPQRVRHGQPSTGLGGARQVVGRERRARLRDELAAGSLIRLGVAPGAVV